MSWWDSDLHISSYLNANCTSSSSPIATCILLSHPSSVVADRRCDCCMLVTCVLKCLSHAIKSWGNTSMCTDIITDHAALIDQALSLNVRSEFQYGVSYPITNIWRTAWLARFNGAPQYVGRIVTIWWLYPFSTIYVIRKSSTHRARDLAVCLQNSSDSGKESCAVSDNTDLMYTALTTWASGSKLMVHLLDTMVQNRLSVSRAA